MRTAVSFRLRRSLGRHTGRVSATLLAVVLVGSGGWGPSAIAASTPTVASTPGATVSAAARPAPASVPGTAPDAANAGLQPSIQFQEAESHRNDKIKFTPGARVTVPFTPRHGDRWKVGGVEPAALPAGRLDGHTIRAQGKLAATGPDAAAAPSVAPAVGSSVDAPNSDPATAVVADGASWHPADDPLAGPTVIQPEATISSTGLRREIFGFLPYWQVNSSTLRLDYTKISTIAYFGVGADAAGNLIKKNADGTTTVGWSGWTSTKLTSIISTAHTNHTRVVLTVQSFAWNSSGLTRQQTLLGSSTNRLNLARQIAAAVRDRGVDGVNLDFEPLASGYDTQFTALVRTIRAELDKVHTGYQLTFDTTGYIGNYPIENATATGGADAIFIMGYDYRGASSSPVGSVAPLNRTGYDIRETVAAYAARVPASKLILGVPYYGRAWSTSTDLLNASNTSGTKYGASTTVIYSTAADYLAQYGRKYDSLEAVAWTAYHRENCTTTYGCVTSWRQIYVDDAAALKSKYDVVNTYGLRGAGIWALGYDGTRTELWQAIKDKFVTTDTTSPKIVATATPAIFSPNGDGAVETSRLAWASSEPISGTARIYHGTTLIRSWTITKVAAGGITWTGTNSAGSPVGDGTYTYRISGSDAAGNLTTSSVRVVVDRTLSTLRWSTSLFFPQDGDLLARTSRASFKLARAATVSMGIYNGSTNIRTIWTNRALVAGSYGWTWNGRTAAGALVPRGRYTMRVVATTSLGTSVLNRTVIVDAFAVTLSASTVTGGQTLTVTVKTAEPLSANPTIRFSQTGKTAVTKKTTSLGGGRYRVSFTVLAGGVGPAAIRVIGHDTSGGINASYATVTVR
jgi:spore germination protein YaaH/flagellar hook assembly protein FlgD